ncbi:hypothetical protein CVD28_01715 [Bacillus sp. M6-12]|uniref:hypothetical protein n=1 Tax=Bacillus sp. M6-12 TaxID=2054166 RepID=UPI000C76C468|nr:hypothetical protein [Bacillus sp. M6-12]PLS19151.1 hypothetical protein CVD28_01715 [Bacillus sp. M6-12]
MLKKVAKKLWSGIKKVSAIVFGIFLLWELDCLDCDCDINNLGTAKCKKTFERDGWTFEEGKTYRFQVESPFPNRYGEEKVKVVHGKNFMFEKDEFEQYFTVLKKDHSSKY